MDKETYQDDKLEKLAGSLLQLNVQIADANSNLASLQSSKEPTPTPEDKTTIGTILAKSKITLAQSKVLTGLSSRTTNSLLNVSALDSTKNIKISVRFKPIGSISQLKQPVFKISRHSKFISINKFLVKKLKVEKVYCYLGNSIVPNPDDVIGNLFDIFKVGDELVITYCNMVAFG